MSEEPVLNGITVYGLDEHQHRVKRYVANDYPIPDRTYLDGYKLFMSRNNGDGTFGETFVTPVFAGPDEACTETFVVIGPFDNPTERDNCWAYIKTKFFRTLVSIRKHDQGAARGVYQYVPLQDFNHPWTDKELYEKYNLSQQDIDYIEKNVKEML